MKLVFRAQDLGSGVQDSGFGVKGLACRFWV